MWWNEAWIRNRALRERVSKVVTHSLCKCQPYDSSPEPSAYILRNGGCWKAFPLFVCLAAESHHNLQKAWSTLKLKVLPAFVRVADLKVINLTTGIGTHDSCVVLQPLEEIVVRMCLVDVHWVPNLKKNFKLSTVTMSLTKRAFSSTHSTMSFPRNNFSSLSFDISLLICNVHILNNLFTTYTNYVAANLLPIV